MKIIVTGDIQIGNVQQAYNKQGLIATVIRENPRLFIHCGDITDLGESGSIINKIYYRLYNACCMPCGLERVNTDSPEQLQEYQEMIQPIRDAGIEILECLGNHDLYAHPVKAVRSYIKRQYGNTYYRRDYEGLSIFCLDVYPNKEICEWLRKELAFLGEDAPFICFFHYPVVGPISDWWTDEEKSTFLNVIRNYNCLALYVGHTHLSGRYDVQLGDKVIPQYDGSGDMSVRVSWESGVLSSEFI